MQPVAVSSRSHPNLCDILNFKDISPNLCYDDASISSIAYKDMLIIKLFLIEYWHLGGKV